MHQVSSASSRTPVIQRTAESLELRNSQSLGDGLAAAQSPAYDTSKHVAPKYNILGHLISSTKQLRGRTMQKSDYDMKMPGNWSKLGQTAADPRSVKTKRELEQKRIEAKKPHQTFDLDGDGVVS